METIKFFTASATINKDTVNNMSIKWIKKFLNFDDFPIIKSSEIIGEQKYTIKVLYVIFIPCDFYQAEFKFMI